MFWSDQEQNQRVVQLCGPGGTALLLNKAFSRPRYQHLDGSCLYTPVILILALSGTSVSSCEGSINETELDLDRVK